MAKKGQKFIHYSFEYKLVAVKKYFEGEMGYKALAKELGEDGLDDHRGKSTSPFKGRPRFKNFGVRPPLS